MEKHAEPLSIGHLERQEQIRSRCIHPSGGFSEFEKAWVDRSIPQHFEEQVRGHLQRVAVKTPQRQLTYDELNSTANRTARAIHRLRGFRLEPVGMLLAKQAPLFPAIFGALKAHKVYVPLDPALPLDRLRYIVQDASPSLLITDSEHLALAEQLANDRCHLMNLDEIDSGSDDNLGAPSPPDTPAWILYTSGSTGKPKGVVQNHRNVLHYVMNYTNYFHLCAEDRMTLLFPFSVNGAAHDTFAALLNGAALLPYDLKDDGIAGLADWLNREDVTIYCSVPTVYRHFLNTVSDSDLFPRIRLVRLIGEPVYKKDVLAYQKHFSPECILVNRLGSTETGSMLFYFIDKESRVEGHNVPVGFPVRENRILLLGGDPSLDGGNDVGEIAVKSRYLSSGYWRRPDLTAAVFLPDPGGEDERIYRTGDLGQKLADGRIVCLGRKDFQVKIRGYRIELSEIEITLEELDEVKEAVVMARDKGSEEWMLVAYVVPATDATPTVTTLRRALEKTLPIHMIPSHFVMLSSLPQAPNGKVDRRALPAPGRSRPNLDNPFVSPGTPVEDALTKIWSSVLQLEQVGIHDSFLELGGDSLLVTQVVSRIRDAFDVEIPIKTIFRSPTVADLSLAVVEALLGSEEACDDLLRGTDGPRQELSGPRDESTE